MGQKHGVQSLGATEIGCEPSPDECFIFNHNNYYRRKKTVRITFGNAIFILGEQH